MIFEISNQSPPPQRSISQTAERRSFFLNFLKNKIVKIPVQKIELTRHSQIPIPNLGYERWEVFASRRLGQRWFFSLVDPNGGLHSFRVIYVFKHSLLALKIRSGAKPSLILCHHPGQSIPLGKPKDLPAGQLNKIINVLFHGSMAESASYVQKQSDDRHDYSDKLKNNFADFLMNTPLKPENLDEFMKAINPGNGVFSRIYHTRRGKEDSLRLPNGMLLKVNLRSSECFSQSKNQYGLYRFLHQYSPASAVEPQLMLLLNEINAYRARNYGELFRFLAYAYQSMIRIHPYLDGNGRLARAIVCFILLQNGVFPKDDFSLPREALYRTEEDLANLISCRFHGCKHAFPKHH